MPGAAYMVSNMSSTCLDRAASNTSTGLARVRRRGSGYSRICRRAMMFRSIAANVWAIRLQARWLGSTRASPPVIQRTDLTIDRAHRAGADYNSGVRLPHPANCRFEEWRMSLNQQLKEPRVLVSLTSRVAVLMALVAIALLAAGCQSAEPVVEMRPARAPTPVETARNPADDMTATEAAIA